MEGGSKNTEEQIITEGGSKDMEEQMTTIEEAEVDILNSFDVAENDKSKQVSKGAHMDRKVGSDDFFAHFDYLDSSVKVNRKNFKKIIKFFFI
jgi:hypothetical protein